MTNSLRQFVEHVARRAETIFKKQGQLLPMYHAIDGAGNNFVLPGPPGTKDEAVAQVRAFLKACDAVRVAFLDEAWMLDMKKSNADIDRIQREGVKRQPGRIEVILISAEDANEGMIMASREIIRHGNRVVLGKLKFQDFDGAEGRMVGLLPVPTQKH